MATTNWKKVLRDLKKAGISVSAAAAALKMPQQTLNDLALGRTKEPKHSVGEGLLAMHAKHVDSAK